MYKWFLCLRYLLKKRLAFFSIGAVMLCTAMVIIVMSVMGGFLEKYRQAAKGLFGDVIIDGPGLVGFPYYEELVRELKAMPGVEAVSPAVYAYGLVQLWRGNTQGIRIVGIEPASKAAVSRFKEGLQFGEGAAGPPSFTPPAGLGQAGPLAARGLPSGCIFGYDVVHYYDEDRALRSHLERFEKVYLTVLPLTATGRLVGGSTPRAKTFGFTYVDTARTGVWDIDSSSVYVDLRTAQWMLDMEHYRDSEGNERPARINQLQIKLAAGQDVLAARSTIQGIYNAFYERHKDSPYARTILFGVVHTSDEKQEKYIGALVKERNLVTIMFAIISTVAVFLVFVIFFMIVVEKTRDIGILKSIGASSRGVASIFLAYGGLIGLAGAMLGMILGVSFVHHINEIHDWLGERLGWQIWDPTVYIFDRIPDEADPSTVGGIMIAAILASILGSLLPAVKAALMQPVACLRYE